LIAFCDELTTLAEQLQEHNAKKLFVFSAPLPTDWQACGKPIPSLFFSSFLGIVLRQ
jgi:hypothetical protein